MTADARTLAVYDAAAERYLRQNGPEWENRALSAFLGRLSEGALILDLGCGPGHFAARMQAAGYRVDPVDASPGMVDLAQRSGVPARKATFDQIDGAAVYDAVWANFSLLHAPRDDVPDHLARLWQALKPGGLIHIGFKVGTGEGRDSLDRFYTYWEVEEMHRALDLAGFIVDEEVKRGKGTGIDSSPFGWALMTGVKNG